MASTEASSGHATRLAGGAAGHVSRPSARSALSDRLPRPWLFPLLVYAVTWVLIAVTWRVANAIYGHSEPWTFYFLFKDATHYLQIARHGYPTVLHFPPKAVRHPYPPFELVNLPASYHPLITYKAPVPPAPYPYLPAFFPGLPTLVWVLHWVTGGSFLAAGLLAAVLSGAAAALAVWAVAARVADRAVVLFCLFPGAMTFGMLYSEPLAVALAAATLLAMLDRRWLLAGLIAALGTFERPTLLVLTGVLAIGAMVAIWQRREWRSLVAAPLSLAGVAAFFIPLSQRYHDWKFWFHTEEHGWQQHVDWGVHVFRLLTWQLGKANTSNAFYTFLLIAMFVVAVAGIGFMIRERLPWPLTLFTAATVLSCIISAEQGTKPRFVWSAFGVFIGLAAARLPKWLFWPLVAVSAGLLVFLIGWWPHHYVGPAP